MVAGVDCCLAMALRLVNRSHRDLDPMAFGWCGYVLRVVLWRQKPRVGIGVADRLLAQRGSGLHAILFTAAHSCGPLDSDTFGSRYLR